MNLPGSQIHEFLLQADRLFPVPLSHRSPLEALASKLCRYGTVLTRRDDSDRIISMVAGYTDNVINNHGYISVVATLPGYARQGLAKTLVKEFLSIAEQKDLDGVHLYTHADNAKAIGMYQDLGFVPWRLPDEPRPDDVHLIYWIKKRGVV